MPELGEDLDLGNYMDQDQDVIDLEEQPAGEGDNTGQGKETQGSEKTSEGSKEETESQDIDLDDLYKEINEDDSSKEKESAETENKEEIDEKSPAPSKDNDSSPSDSPIIAYAKLLSDEGVFSSSFDEEEFKKLVEEKGDPTQALIAYQQKELEEKIEAQVNEKLINDEDRNIYEGKKAGVELDKLGRIDKSIDSYTKVSDEDFEDEESGVDLAKKVITDNMKVRGFDETEIQERLEYLEEKGTLTEKAKNHKENTLKYLKEKRRDLIEEAETAKQQREQEEQNKVKELEKDLFSRNEFLKGLTLNDDTKKAVFKSMTEPVDKDEDGNPLDGVMAVRKKNPMAFDEMLHYYAHLGLFNIDEKGNPSPSIDKFKNVAQTKATNDFEKLLKDTGFNPGSKSKKNPYPSKSIGLSEEMDDIQI